MRLILTSSPTGALDGSYKVDGFDDRNRFAEYLRSIWNPDAKCLMITAFPDDIEASEEMTDFFRSAVEKNGMSCAVFDLWDARTSDEDRDKLREYDFIFLGGGHVPTQNAFFQRLGLRELLNGFKGTVIGISAGSMNCAEVVYAQPEEKGEVENPDYRRFIPGLGLTKINVLPHYQMVRDMVLDGYRMMEDITFGDSFGRHFLAMPDGSYILVENGVSTVFGEAWSIADGRITKICDSGRKVVLE